MTQPGSRAALWRGLTADTLRYGAASALALAADFAVYVLLIRLAGVHYLVAAPLGFAVGLATIYALSILWVFRHRRLDDARIEFAVFAAIGFAGMALNQAIVYCAVEGLGFSYESAKLASAAAGFAFNFGLRRFFLFSVR